MGSKIKLVDTSGRRLPKKKKTNQTDVTSNGESLLVNQSSISGGAVSSSGLIGSLIGVNVYLDITNKRLQFKSLDGNFQNGECIEADNGATATIVYFDCPNDLLGLTSIVGDFSCGCASCFTGLTSNAMATPNELSGAFSTDQSINLVGGTSYIISSVIVTNPSSNLCSTGNASLYSLPGRTGLPVTKSDCSSLCSLSYPINYINMPANDNACSALSRVSSPLYFTIDCSNCTPATADIYIYGHTF